MGSASFLPVTPSMRRKRRPPCWNPGSARQDAKLLFRVKNRSGRLADLFQPDSDGAPVLSSGAGHGGAARALSERVSERSSLRGVLSALCWVRSNQCRVGGISWRSASSPSVTWMRSAPVSATPFRSTMRRISRTSFRRSIARHRPRRRAPPAKPRWSTKKGDLFKAVERSQQGSPSFGHRPRNDCHRANSKPMASHWRKRC